MTQVPPEPQPGKPTKADWLRVAIPVVVVSALVVVAWRLGYFDLRKPRQLNAAAQRAEGTPWLGPIVIAVYALLATLAAPVSPLAYAAGAIFGVAKGSLYVWIGSMIGAGAGYFVARGIWAQSARRLLGRYRDKIRKLRHGNVFLGTLRLQLMPIVPFGIFNYAAGAGRFSFVQFMGGTALGIVPGTVAAVYVGDRIMAGIAGSDRRAFLVACIVMATLLLVSFLPTILRKNISGRGTRDEERA